MNISFFEKFKKVTSVTTITLIVFSIMSPVAFAQTNLQSVTSAAQVWTLTSGTPGTVTYLVTVQANGNNSTLNVNMGTAGLPTGVTASFSVNPVSFTTGGNKTTTLTLTSSALASAGITNFQITANAATPASATLTIGSPSDTTPPTITSISSTTANGNYTTGTVIPLNVTFSEAVTSTGNVTLTTDTGRTCTFTVASNTTGSCNYTVQAGDNSSDLNISTVSGTIKDGANLAMVNFTPTTNLAANKAIVIDTTKPVITLVGTTPVTVEAGSVYADAGATALDAVDGDRTANIVTVNSVNSNAVGTYTVTYNVSDVAGNAATQVTRTVNVVDTTGPSVPTNTLPNGTSVNTDGWDFTWNASTDNQPGAITYEYQASQNPAVDGLGVLTTGIWSSGSLATNMIHSAGAAEGVWYWQVRAKDALGNYSAWSPVATVTKDTIAPVISTDSSFLTVGAVTATGAIITYTTVPTATDVGTPSPLVTCWPASGTNFALNSTATITCNSTDNAGNTGIQTFNIIIEDEEDPVLLITGDVYVEAVAPSSATATFSVSATDNVDTFGAPVKSGSNPAIVCSHLSGDTFNFGTTIVTCTATDSEGNDTTDDFNVVVEDTIEPTLVITMDDTDLNVGDTALVTFTFSEAPVNFDNADVSAENGSIDTIAGSGTVYTATFTPTADVEDATNVITVGTDWSDANTPTGNAPTSTTVSTNYTIDTATPIISNVTTEVLYPAGLSIRWTTNEPTTSQVQYGTTTSYGSTSPLDSALVTEHIVDIHGLDAPAEYHFEIITTDGSGNTASTTTSGTGTASTSEGGSGGVTSTGGDLFQTPAAPIPTTPTQPTTPDNNSNPETPNNTTPENTTPEVTPTQPTNPTDEITPENTENPNPTTPTQPTTPTGGTTGPAFNPADATLDIGGAGTAEETPAVEETTPTVDPTLDAGGWVIPEENSYTLLWTLLALIALLNTWWFFVAKNKNQTTHRRD